MEAWGMSACEEQLREGVSKDSSRQWPGRRSQLSQGRREGK